jgi:hypothetical protein
MINQIIANNLAECENPDLFLRIKLDVVTFMQAVEVSCTYLCNYQNLIIWIPKKSITNFLSKMWLRCCSLYLIDTQSL